MGRKGIQAKEYLTSAPIGELFSVLKVAKLSTLIFSLAISSVASYAPTMVVFQDVPPGAWSDRKKHFV
jgi:hypothetical protein